MTKDGIQSPFLSGETYSGLLDRLEAEPAATGDGALVSREAIEGDRFFSHRCFKCWSRASLFAFEHRFVSLCPQCATERIVHMAAEGQDLPPSVLWLHLETSKEIQYEERRAREALSVKLDDFYRCHRCGKIVHPKDARYWFPPGENVSPAYCGICSKILSSGLDEPRVDRPWERDFEFPEE